MGSAAELKDCRERHLGERWSNDLKVKDRSETLATGTRRIRGAH